MKSKRILCNRLECFILNNSSQIDYYAIHEQLFAIQFGYPAMRACTNLEYLLECHEENHSK